MRTRSTARDEFPDRPAAIVKTTDGGATWTSINMSAHAAILVDIYFKNAMEGWVVGGRDDVGVPMARRKRDDVEPVVLHTVDGGVTWTDRLEPIRRMMPRGEWGWKIQAVDAQTMFVSLENFLDGAILRSDDGGLNWQRLRINDRQRNSNLEGIGFVDRNRGWVGGGATLTPSADLRAPPPTVVRSGTTPIRSDFASTASASSAIRSRSATPAATPSTSSPTSQPRPEWSQASRRLRPRKGACWIAARCRSTSMSRTARDG